MSPKILNPLAFAFAEPVLSLPDVASTVTAPVFVTLPPTSPKILNPSAFAFAEPVLLLPPDAVADMVPLLFISVAISSKLTANAKAFPPAVVAFDPARAVTDISLVSDAVKEFIFVPPTAFANANPLAF